MTSPADAPTGTGDGGILRDDGAGRTLGRPRRIHALSVLVLLSTLALFALAGALTFSVHRDTEQRLLERQTRQAASTLQVGIGAIVGILAPAAELAASSGGDAETFASSLGPVTGEGRRYLFAGVWPVGGDEPIATVGSAPLIAADPERLSSILAKAANSTQIAVAGLVGDEPTPRYAYAYASQAPGTKYVVYVEAPLPSPRRGFVDRGSAFSNLHYALYDDQSEDDSALLFASVEELPLEGRRATAVVPFGDAELLLVATPVGTLSGGLSRSLPWIVALVGVALGLGLSGLVERLLRRRDDAEAASVALAALSEENARLFSEQRGIAETLQRSLLPDRLPNLPRAHVTARYWPAGTASEVGGDFYDLFVIGGGRWGLAIGDVCGKGVDAAALTGVARHTIQAAARHVESPDEVLHWVHEAIRAKGTSVFCTVCFAVLTIDGDAPVRIDVALGGHPPPLLCRRDGTSHEIGVVGTVLGLIEPTVTTRSYELAPGDTLVLFTDGLTDAPHETAVRLEEVQRAHAAAPGRSPDRIADEIQRLIEVRRPLGSGDDTALLIVRVER